MKRELVIIGGGAAGLSAAIEAKRSGVKDVLILERSEALGGILRQCIHTGFGLHKYKEELSGTEFAARLLSEAEGLGVERICGAFVIAMSPERILTVVQPDMGLFTIEAGAVILAMGCRERSRGAMMIPGKRIAGIITAGTAQRYLNLKGYLPGKRLLILGSGDIGLIMARQFIMEGAEVLGVVEIQPRSGGLARNIVQCLEDFNIPIRYSSTVTDIQGRGRVEQVTVSKVDENLKPIPGTEEIITCDTLLISAGLIPENELTKAAGIEMDPATGGPRVDAGLMTTAAGIFACGNVLHIHELVDHVAAEGAEAGKSAAAWLRGLEYTAARKARPGPPARYGREDGGMICLSCPRGCSLSVDEAGNVSGNACPRGEVFARQELMEPMRVLSCLMRISRREQLFPVKSTAALPRRLMQSCAGFIYENPIEPGRLPIRVGDVMIENILGTGVDIIATGDVE